MNELDNLGEWGVTKGNDCDVRLLINPSQSFRDWQASLPIIEPIEDVNPVVEIAKIKTRLEKAGIPE